jgi:hypothetical protein
VNAHSDNLKEIIILVFIYMIKESLELRHEKKETY